MSATVIRLDSAAGIVGAIPHVIGFHPTESIVIMAFTGKRLTVTARLDIDAADTLPVHVARMADTGADSVVIARYTETESWADAMSAGRAVVSELDGVTVKESVVVSGGRFRSALCPDTDCCPIDGQPVPTDSPVADAMALTGRRTLADRGALAESIAYDARLTPDARQRELAQALADPARRDRVLAVTADLADPGETVAHLVALATVTGDDTRPAVLTALAVVAYLAGDGALANVALDNGAAGSLAALMRQWLAMAGSPDALRQVLRSV